MSGKVISAAAVMVVLVGIGSLIASRSGDSPDAAPVRAQDVPGFAAVKQAALEAGALAASLSGSGPSLFALCRGPDRAREVAARMVRAFREAADLSAHSVISPGRAPGARVLSP